MRAYPVTIWWVFFVAAVSSVALAATLSCSPDLPVSWMVNDSATASDLARAANCSGGAFDVEWIGHVEIPETIYVIDDTVMNIAGVGAGAIADGTASKQFLNIVNATVRISGLHIQNCAAWNGGAIYAETSVLKFDNTTWSDNIADADGGAVFVSSSPDVSWSGETIWSDNAAAHYGGAVLVHNSSNVSWSGETTWSNNNAGNVGGGAVSVIESSDVSWSGESTWSKNAAVLAGAVLVLHSSNVSWSGEMTWSGNTAAEQGGAVLVYNSSDVSWSGQTSWSNNTAENGGAIVVESSSGVSWSEQTMLSNNTAVVFGGAIWVWNSSDVSWSGETTCSGNTAGHRGGAVSLWQSFDVSWTGETTLFNNAAGDSGGAVLVRDCSNVSWNGKTTFSENTAEEDGGAVLVFHSSDVSWSGQTTSSCNSAGDDGGAAYVEGSYDVSWSGETTWFGNNASGVGGAVTVQLSSSGVSWSGESTWSFNTAGEDGGAVYIFSSLDVSWSGETSWCNNTAFDTGGAVFLVSSSDVSWSGEATWSNNSAGNDGGAICVYNSSDVSWSGTTTWSYNTASDAGGALYVFGSSIGSIPNQSVFEGNTANGVGGAIVLSGVARGPTFVQSKFTANSSPRGGAVYSVNSGTITDLDQNPLVPVTYKDCLFEDNWASVTGGAIEDVAGNDELVDTVFLGNKAGVGGALRLGGFAVLTNCTFIDNVADEDGGAAISNFGVLEMKGNSSRFSRNVFWCDNGTYVDEVAGNRYERVCDGCPEECVACDVEDEDSMPICVPQMEHTRSEGGNTTVEMLEVDPGYWRATNESLVVLACYNERACRGGLTNADDFCEQGYEGPYCSVCSWNYSRGLPFTCTKCVDYRGGIAIMIAVAFFVLSAVIVLCMHLVLEEMDGTHQGIIHCITKYLPVQSIKIIVVVWQILTQFSSVVNVTYPDVYQRFLDGVNFLNFNALWIPSAGCIVDVDFHHRLLTSTIGPLIALALLAGTYSVANRRNCGSEVALRKIGERHLSMVLLISFLVYSSVSATVFQTFACEELDDDKEYLRVDYRIECDSAKHQAFKVFASIMIFVYPVGIPLFYMYLLCKNRRVLESKVERAASLRVQPISDLWLPYKPERFYFELIECLRRISLTGVVVFIYPNTAPQVAVTLAIAFLFVVVTQQLDPYVSMWDARISLVGHVIVFISMYVALLSKVDVTDLRADSQEVLGGILVAAHACLVVAVVWEAISAACSLRQEDTVPRSHSSSGVESFSLDPVAPSSGVEIELRRTP